MSEASEITKNAKSNLAFAFACLSKQRRQDMTKLYAFCRTVDDLADSPDQPLEEKITGLTKWKNVLSDSPPNTLTTTEKETLEIRDRYHIKNIYFQEIIAGCESDLNPSQRFPDWPALQQYTYQVASCVGLASIEIFGCKSPAAQKYAIALGHALQLTNILRDVGEDLDDNNRVYLPLSDMAMFDYTEQDLANKTHDQRFTNMMQHIADRAEQYYQEAASLLPEQDRRALKSSEAMRRIYHSILKKLQRTNFPVFDQRCTLSKPHKLWILLTSLLGIFN